MIGVGLDSVEVERFRRVLQRTPTVADRLFTADEQAYAAIRKDPTERLAARFAAKEAVMKAMGVGLGAFGWHDVEVGRHESGAPELVLRGRAAALAGERGITGWRLSMTHTDRTASAVVVAL